MPENAGNPLFDVVNDACLGAFGEPANFSWTPSTGETVEDLEGIYDARHYQAEVQGEVGVSDYSPTLHCRRADVDYGDSGGLVAGDTVTVRGQDFVVKDARPDAEGWVVLDLRRP